jgi:hypothetical protein
MIFAVCPVGHLGKTTPLLQTQWSQRAMAGVRDPRRREVWMSSEYKRTSITHTSRGGLNLTREVRWYPSNRQAYRWSEQEARWVYLGHADSLDEARFLASIDMYNARRWGNLPGAAAHAVVQAGSGSRYPHQTRSRK